MFYVESCLSNVAPAYCRNIKSINVRESCLKYGVALPYRVYKMQRIITAAEAARVFQTLDTQTYCFTIMKTIV